MTEIEGRAPHVSIIGTGAMAMRFGAALARAGAEVALLGTWAAAIQAISERGIAVDSGATVWTVPARAYPLGAPLPSAPLVLVLVKAFQTRDVAEHAAELVRDDGLILTLQNGLGNRELLGDAAGAERVTAGVTSVGATVRGPGFVRLAGAGSTTVGRPPPLGNRVDDAVRGLRTAGFDVSTTDDIDALLWRKLAVNCAINPLTALHGVPNGALLEDAELRETMAEAAREVAAVARAIGIDLDGRTGDPREAFEPVTVAEDVARRTASNRSSMLQDVERGSRTEIDAICGAVVMAGRRVDVATPVNLELWRRVSALDGTVVDEATGVPLRQRRLDDGERPPGDDPTEDDPTEDDPARRSTGDGPS